MDGLKYIGQLGRRTGKTTAICKAAKEINATVVCFSEQEAERVKEEHGVKAIGLDRCIRGTTGPYLIDTEAVGVIAQRYDNKIQDLNNKLLDTNSQYGKRLYALQKEVEELRDELYEWKKLYG